MSAARRTPLIGAYPKIFLPASAVVSGLLALVSVPVRPEPPETRGQGAGRIRCAPAT